MNELVDLGERRFQNHRVRGLGGNVVTCAESHAHGRRAQRGRIIDSIPDKQRSPVRGFTPDEVELAVQINGKVRGRITVAREAREDEIRGLALAEPRVAEHLQGKEMVKFVVVPGRLVSMVVR